MKEMLLFITDNYIIFIIAFVMLVISLVGYIMEYRHLRITEYKKKNKEETSQEEVLDVL